LLGAVMIFSASAVTAEQQYGHSYIFLARQAAWLLIGLLGMFALMKTDYRRLREPAVIYPVVFVVLRGLVVGDDRIPGQSSAKIQPGSFKDAHCSSPL